MFIRLVLGGQSLFDNTDVDDSIEQYKKAKVQNITLSVALDIVYNATGGKNWTPKHIGLASTLHQTTGPRSLSSYSIMQVILLAMKMFYKLTMP